MKTLYSSPLRVYLCLAALMVVGLFSGYKLPISLFPNSSKPRVRVWASYGNLSAEDFISSYGLNLESQLQAITSDGLEVEKLASKYDRGSVSYGIDFKWGANPKEALKETQLVVQAFAGRLPLEIRDSISVNSNNENQGFVAISFFSTRRSVDDLYKLLDPVLSPPLAQIPDANESGLWNPESKEVSVELNQTQMATLQLLPADIERAVTAAVTGYGGGTLTVGVKSLSIQLPRAAQTLEDVGRILVPTPSGKMIHLADVARIDFGASSTQTRSFKTSGAPSLILFADPRPGGNIKRMAEDVIAVVQKAAPSFPPDVQYRILVDPSEFIRSAVNNVFHEVLLGAILAVTVLFVFIGSFRNTVTAAIEIPLSMILAFILMKLSGMNLNLISLGGLALSSGMNVDASVVVMENIFRRFEEQTSRLDFQTRLKLICQAVAEVRFSVIASTIASLVVFIPLAFTSDLSYALLGDLAKTVVFSHGFSAFVALILVPTVRLQLMSTKGAQNAAPEHSRFEPAIRKLEDGYAGALRWFISNRRAKWAAYLALPAVLVGLAVGVLPRLPREIIGRPDTDWIFLGVNTQGNRLVKQMESQTEEVENRLLDKFGSRIQYTFTQVNSANGGFILARLKDKKDMKLLWKDLQAFFTNTPVLRYWVEPWNPAELPIPDPPQMRLVVRGGDLQERAQVAEQIENLLDEKQVFPRVWSEPNASRSDAVVLRPVPEQWFSLKQQGATLSPADLADISTVGTGGRKIGTFPVDGRNTNIVMRYPEGTLTAPEDLAALPIGIGSRLVPLQALARVSVEPVLPTIAREDGRERFLVLAKEDEDTKSEAPKALKQAEEMVSQWRQGEQSHTKTPVSVFFEDAEKDLHEALRQLGFAVALSILLTFLTLVIQFGSIVNAVLVLVAIPLGFIGVLVSLFVFQSTLSLNSVLGVILLNGIAVANSIILVDFLKRGVDQGLPPGQAAVEAGRRRLRPILITSLTTILGMLPVALGFGEGGRILQPLGIAVSGGLWVSMSLTLFIVPALQVEFLDWKRRRVRGGALRAVPLNAAGEGAHEVS